MVQVTVAMCFHLQRKIEVGKRLWLWQLGQALLLLLGWAPQTTWNALQTLDISPLSFAIELANMQSGFPMRALCAMFMWLWSIFRNVFTHWIKLCSGIDRKWSLNNVLMWLWCCMWCMYLLFRASYRESIVPLVDWACHPGGHFRTAILVQWRPFIARFIWANIS